MDDFWQKAAKSVLQCQQSTPYSSTYATDMASSEIFPGEARSTLLLICFRLLMINC